MNYIQQDNSLSRTSDKSKGKNRDLENFAGYRDIRIYMLKLIVRDENEQKDCLRQIDIGYWRAIIKIASNYSDKVLLRKAFANLSQIEQPNLDDKICYYRKIYPLWGKFLRTYKKVILTVRK